MKTDDMTAPSEQCQNILMSSIDWFKLAAQIQLFYGGNDGSIKDYFVCAVIVGKTSSFGLEVIAVNSRPAVRLHGQVENIDSSDNVSDFEKIKLCLPFKVSVTLHKVFHWKKENILLAF